MYKFLELLYKLIDMLYSTLKRKKNIHLLEKIKLLVKGSLTR